MSYQHLGPCLCGGCDSCLSAQGYQKCEHRRFECETCWCEHGVYVAEEKCEQCTPEEFDEETSGFDGSPQVATPEESSP